MAATYAELSPDGPGHFAVTAEKQLVMTRTDPVLSAADVATVRARTLVVAADDDIVTLEHTVAFYRALTEAELAIVPGTSHALVEEKPELCARLIRGFLEDDPPIPLIPIRRATG